MCEITLLFMKCNMWEQFEYLTVILHFKMLQLVQHMDECLYSG